MKLIKPNLISGEILTLLDEADETVIFISPYCNFQKWFKLNDKLKSALNRNIEIEFYIREGESKTFEEVQSLGISPFMVKGLHCKIYMNEKYAIVSSMNLLLNSEINSLEIAYKTENAKEYSELFKFANRYIRKTSNKNSYFNNPKIEHQTSLGDFLMQRKIQVFENEGTLAIKTSHNNYSAFILNQGFNNKLIMNGIVSQKELEYARHMVPELERNTNLKIECIEGYEGKYSQIEGSTIQKIKSKNILELESIEIQQIGNSILGFINEIEQLKEATYKQKRF